MTGLSKIDTTLVGMGHIVRELESCLDNPPHIYLTGFPGTGKTTLTKEFLRAYFKKHGVCDKDRREYCLEVSSNQDRGIHTFRQILNDHVRWIAPRKGVYRWIVVDDCDTLPAISQQALRRPMETCQHITRFIFIGQNKDSLIGPLQSRCHIITIEPRNDREIYDEILRREGLDKESITEDAVSQIISMSFCSVMKFQSLARMLSILKVSEGLAIIDADYIKKSFDPYIYKTMGDLLFMLINNDTENAQKQMYMIWEIGYSFEDILFELEHSLLIMNIVNHRAWYNVQQFLIKSWIYHSQSRSSIIDLMTACNELKPWS
jgi:DNA polymerase III delta prime subunit